MATPQLSRLADASDADAVATPTPLRRDAMKRDDARVVASASPTELQTPGPTRREEDASSTPVPRLADASDAEFSTPRGAAVTSDGDASAPDGSPSTRAVEDFGVRIVARLVRIARLDSNRRAFVVAPFVVAPSRRRASRSRRLVDERTRV